MLTLESKLFKIPIEKYEKDIETESAKGKKNEIIDLLTNYNKLLSKEEFKKIEYQLHEACSNCDLDLIKIYLSETVENDSKELKFKIDRKNGTASLFEVNENIEEVIIPRTVEHKSFEYLITSISGTSKNLKTLKFVENSAVKTIHGNSFQESQIEEIHFPDSLIELRKGWCQHTKYLTKIIISPSNDHFIFKNNEYLLGKSGEKNDEFDILLFVVRDIVEISIPSTVSKICDYAFSCSHLTKVEIPTNSNLHTIGPYAFYHLDIKEISIPSKVSTIYKYAFYNCFNLTKVEIPSNLKIIEEYAFYECLKLTQVIIPKNSNLHTIGPFAFYHSKIKEIFIPPKVSKIGEYAFYNCCNLVKIEIPTNTNLQTIESNAFSFSKITELFIPPTICKICEFAFELCKNLLIIEVPEKSKLKSFPFSAFDKKTNFIIMIPTSYKQFFYLNRTSLFFY